jgi:hypothetical protein
MMKGIMRDDKSIIQYFVASSEHIVEEENPMHVDNFLLVSCAKPISSMYSQSISGYDASAGYARDRESSQAVLSQEQQ